MTDLSNYLSWVFIICATIIFSKLKNSFKPQGAATWIYLAQAKWTPDKDSCQVNQQTKFP